MVKDNNTFLLYDAMLPLSLLGNRLSPALPVHTLQNNVPSKILAFMCHSVRTVHYLPVFLFGSCLQSAKQRG